MNATRNQCPRRKLFSIEPLEMRQLMAAYLGLGAVAAPPPPYSEPAEVGSLLSPGGNFQPAPIDAAQIQQLEDATQPLVDAFALNPSPESQAETSSAIALQLAAVMDEADNHNQRNALYAVYVSANEQMAEAIVQACEQNPTPENLQWAHTTLTDLLAEQMQVADNHRARNFLYNSYSERVNGLYGEVVVEPVEVGPAFTMQQHQQGDEAPGAIPSGSSAGNDSPLDPRGSVHGRFDSPVLEAVVNDLCETQSHPRLGG